MVTAKLLAEYILATSHCDINNLRLQKHLYLVTLDFYHRYRKWLVEEDFVVHQYGPTIESVYMHYKPYGSRDIDIDYDVELLGVGSEEKYDIDISIDRLADMRSWEIIETVHKSDGAWKRARNEGLFVIPREYIIQEANKYGK